MICPELLDEPSVRNYATSSAELYRMNISPRPSPQQVMALYAGGEAFLTSKPSQT
jgi:hypothetical protein